MSTYDNFQIIPRHLTSYNGESVLTFHSTYPTVPNSMYYRQSSRPRLPTCFLRIPICPIHLTLMLPSFVLITIFSSERRMEHSKNIMFFGRLLRKLLPFSRRLLINLVPAMKWCTILRVFLFRRDPISRQRTTHMGKRRRSIPHMVRRQMRTRIRVPGLTSSVRKCNPFRNLIGPNVSIFRQMALRNGLLIRHPIMCHPRIARMRKGTIQTSAI